MEDFARHDTFYAIEFFVVISPLFRGRYQENENKIRIAPKQFLKYKKTLAKYTTRIHDFRIFIMLSFAATVVIIYIIVENKSQPVDEYKIIIYSVLSLYYHFCFRYLV